MSVVSLAPNDESSISSDQLRSIAAAYNIHFSSAEDEAAYLLLLRSVEGVFRTIETLPPYTAPQVTPQATVGGHRRYWIPSKEENPLNAWRFRCDLVSESSSSSLLAGRAIAVKDNVSISGLPTTLGTFPRLLTSNGSLPVSAIDATVVSRLLKSGAVIRGTSTCENYGTGPLSYSAATGPVDNPWAPGYTCGGSSSGAAALVAVKEVKQQRNSDPLGEGVDIAIGTDQGGSVRIPAAYTGIYGFKPTFGLVPYTGIASGARMVDHCGIFARNVSDIATTLEAIAGYDELDPRMSPEAPLPDSVKKYSHVLNDFMEQSRCSETTESASLRFAVVKESFDAPGLSKEVIDTVRLFVQDLSSHTNRSVDEISIPLHSLGPAIWAAATRLAVVDSGIRAQPSELITQPLPHLNPRWPPDQEMYDLLTSSNPAVMNLIFQSAYVKDNVNAELLSKVRTHCLQLRDVYDKALEDCDILITPAAPTVAMKHPSKIGPNGDTSGGHNIMDKIKLAVGSTSNTCPFNISGHPAIVVPCGWGLAEEDPKKRLSIGVQLIGRRFEDDTVLKAANLVAAIKRGQSDRS